MKVGVLTSSRAEFGIYLPLLLKISKDNYFQLEIIAFGTHLSKFHGFTLDEIKSYQFNTIHTLTTTIANDDSNSIATSYALTCQKFADFWNTHNYDLVFCLGDRYEMNAAVQSGIPFGIKFAHIHGGETTLGAIDNIYRHQITLASSVHFTSTEQFKQKIATLIDTDKFIYNVGALSLDEINNTPIISEIIFREKYKIKNPYILVTFHPETVSFDKNNYFAEQMYFALKLLASKIDIVITMPNSDTLGSIYRQFILKLKEEHPENIFAIENFGKTNYFAAMNYASLLLGNTSSGIIEAASFKKYVVNVGDRQKGRLKSKNTFDVDFNCESINNLCLSILKKGNYIDENIYYRSNVADNIIMTLKKNNGNL